VRRVVRGLYRVFVALAEHGGLRGAAFVVVPIAGRGRARGGERGEGRLALQRYRLRGIRTAWPLCDYLRHGCLHRQYEYLGTTDAT
jgi:hypothetical protein